MKQPGREDWQRISRILEEALELPPAALPAFLDRECGADATLRAYVERLLAADRDADGYLEVEATAWVELLQPERVEPNVDPQSVTGQRLGPWRLIREIGRGGMGAVMLAERADGTYEQQVAIKRIRRDVDSPDALRRFDRERRILARLEHPNIARAVDGGTGPDGTPWLAMEYVAGEPITTWCVRRNASLDATLAHFEQAVRAVQFAHQQFVIHRDLKPSNIFVSESGEVKLLDFGIAKLLGGDGDDPSSTIDLERRLTPHYAAPEQIRGDPVSTATDVYALGVVLYELLTGMRPHASASDTLAAVRRVLDVDPDPPSAVLARSDRDLRYRAWRDRLRGDLDNIVLKALRREPTERYPSAQALLDDLERWRRQLPVQATPHTRTYRTRRFVRRNRLLVVSGSAVAVSLMTGLLAVSWQSRVAREERDRAQLEARKAQTVSAFVGSVFDIANPNVAKGDTLSAQRLLDQSAERAERELADQPEVQAEIFRRLAAGYHGLLVFDRAQAMAERALEVARRALGPQSPEVATGLIELGGILTNRGRYTEAESTFVRALALSRLLHGPRHPDVAQSLSWLGTINRMLARFEQAERFFRESIVINEATLDANHPRLAPDIDALGMVLAARGRNAEALALFERALAIRRRVLGEEHIETAYTMENIARTLPNLGRFAEAESLHWRTLEIRRRLLGPGNVTLARTLSPLAFIYLGRNQYRRADSLMTEALRIFRSVLGDEHVETLIALADAGHMRKTVGDIAAAESLFTRAFAVASRVYGSDHGLTLLALGRLAALRGERGDVEGAERLFRDALVREGRSRGTATNAALSYELSWLLRRQGRYAEAESIMRQRVQSMSAHYGWDRMRALLELGIVLRLRARFDESRRHLEESSAIARKVVQPASHVAGWVQAELGRTLVALGQHARGDSLLRSGIRIMETAHSRGDPLAAEGRVALAMSLVRRDRDDEGRQLLMTSLPILTRQRGVPDPIVTQARAWLAAPARQRMP